VYSFIGGGGREGYNYGDGNTAFGDFTAILGGKRNFAGDTDSIDHTIGRHATIAGGWFNIANGECANVSGGIHNKASGQASFVGGGGGAYGEDQGNNAFGDCSAILGGIKNIAGDPNLISHLYGTNAVISGGSKNIASGHHSFVGGGEDNIAVGGYDSVVGDAGAVYVDNTLVH
jgi:hypothetical protein